MLSFCHDVNSVVIVINPCKIIITYHVWCSYKHGELRNQTVKSYLRSFVNVIDLKILNSLNPTLVSNFRNNQQFSVVMPLNDVFEQH